MGERFQCKGTGRQPLVSLARRLGLDGTFTGLEIQGLGKLAGSRKISRRNKEFILRFLNHISAEVSERRLTFYTHKLGKLACWFRKDFDAATEDDIRRVVTFISKGPARENGGRFSLGSVHGYKVTIKRFYRWLEGHDEEYPRKVRWIRSNGDTTRIKEPEELLTPREVFEMIRHARNPRDKAMISFLYETGARVSEMLSMKVRHLEFDAALVRATLPVSKTQTRRVPLVSCRKHLAVWVNYHPQKDNPEAALWSNLKGDGSQPLRGSTVGDILKSVARDAGITKRVYTHLFRACSITHKQLAGWPQQAIHLFHGLSKESRVMRHYSHLSYGNLEEIQRRTNGLPVEDQGGLNRGVRCPGCGRTNPLCADMCQCGLPTEMKAAPARSPSLESQLEARLEKRMQEFFESRQFYDRLMERFMSGLLKKARESPEIIKAITEIGKDLRGGPESGWLPKREANADGDPVTVSGGASLPGRAVAGPPGPGALQGRETTVADRDP